MKYRTNIKLVQLYNISVAIAAGFARSSTIGKTSSHKTYLSTHCVIDSLINYILMYKNIVFINTIAHYHQTKILEF